MRSSKQRSRSKSNRQRPLGNVVNRVFDSSGPDGKVRGTPQQIIDKYLLLARDAQLANDRVAAENFLQHAEHYTRMLAEAQAESDARRQPQDQPRDNAQSDGNPRDGGQRDGGQRDRQPQTQHRPARDERSAGADAAAQILGDPTEGGDGDSMLVDTPETRHSDSRAPESAAPESSLPESSLPLTAAPAHADQDGAPVAEGSATEAPGSDEAKPRNTRKPRARSAGRKSEGADGAADAPARDEGTGAAEDSAPAPRKRAVRKPRNAPRKAEGGGSDDGAAAPKSAAE